MAIDKFVKLNYQVIYMFQNKKISIIPIKTILMKNVKSAQYSVYAVKNSCRTTS